MTNSGHEQDTGATPAEPGSGASLVAQQLYVEHLQQRLAQGDVLGARVFDLEREVAYLRTELRGMRRSLGSIEQARAAAAKKCASDHVDKTGYRRAKRQVKDLERQLRQLRASRSYRAGRVIGKAARLVAPRSGSGTDSPPPLEPAPRRAEGTGPRAELNGSPAPSSRPAPDPSSAVLPAHLSPVTLLDCRGCDVEHVAAAAAQLTADVGVAVSVQDTLNFAAARDRGMRIEYIPDEAGLAESVGTSVAADVVARRWEEILAQHRPTEIYRPVVAERGVRLELVWFSTTEQLA